MEKKKYNFNKKLFRVWLAIVLILLGALLVNYSDYKEYNASCFQTQCLHNVSFFKDMYIIESNIFEKEEYVMPSFNLIDNRTSEFLHSGEYIIYSNYEKKPWIIKYFLQITIYSLALCFLINHIQFKRGVKDSNYKS